MKGGAVGLTTEQGPRKRRGRAGGAAALPATELGGGNISFSPRNLEGAQRKTVENARNSITPNIQLVETRQVRKIGAPRLPKRVPPIQGPSQIGLSTPKLVFPLKYTAG